MVGIGGCLVVTDKTAFRVVAHPNELLTVQRNKAPLLVATCGFVKSKRARWIELGQVQRVNPALAEIHEEIFAYIRTRKPELRFTGTKRWRIIKIATCDSTT